MGRDRALQRACSNAECVPAGSIGSPAHSAGANGPLERTPRGASFMGQAVKLAARLEGVLFDPVYSGKGLAGLIDLIRKGHFADCENVVFLHTGGSASLFGYPDIFGLPGYTD